MSIIHPYISIEIIKIILIIYIKHNRWHFQKLKQKVNSLLKLCMLFLSLSKTTPIYMYSTILNLFHAITIDTLFLVLFSSQSTFCIISGKFPSKKCGLGPLIPKRSNTLKCCFMALRNDRIQVLIKVNIMSLAFFLNIKSECLLNKEHRS